MGDVVEEKSPSDDNILGEQDESSDKPQPNQNLRTLEMKRSLQEMIPALEQKLTNSSINVNEIESLLSRFDPATLDPLMEIIQYIQQKQNRQNASDGGKSGVSKMENGTDNSLPHELALKLNGIHGLESSTSENSNGLGNSLSQTQMHTDNPLNQLMLPSQMSVDKSHKEFISISPDKSGSSLASQPLWSQTSQDSSRNNNNKLKRSWSEQTSPGAVDPMEINSSWQSGFGDDGTPDVFSFSPTSQVRFSF